MNISVKLSKIAPNDQESVTIVPRGSLANSWIASTFITVVSVKYLARLFWSQLQITEMSLYKSRLRGSITVFLVDWTSRIL